MLCTPYQLHLPAMQIAAHACGVSVAIPTVSLKAFWKTSQEPIISRPERADDAEQYRPGSPARPCVCRLLPAPGNPLLEAVLFRLWELVSRWPCWQRLLAPSPSWELPPPGRRCEWLCARRGPRRECGCEDQE